MQGSFFEFADEQMLGDRDGHVFESAALCSAADFEIRSAVCFSAAVLKNTSAAAVAQKQKRCSGTKKCCKKRVEKA